MGQRVLQRRVDRERRTVDVMIGIHCHDRHGGDGLCADCTALRDYAMQRIKHCPYGLDKPTCVNCPIHCYKPARRAEIRDVMRYAGPRMPRRHPVLTVFHFIDGRRAAPPLPSKRSDSTPAG